MTGPKPPGDLAIRPAVEADAAWMSAVHESCFPVGWEAGYFAKLLRSPNVCAIVATLASDPSPVGFAITRSAGNEAEILSVAVAAPARGLGIAARMIRACIASLAERGIDEMFLEVSEQNAAAIRLYHSLGFTKVGQRKSYYSPGESGDLQDAIVMKLDLRNTTAM